MRLTGGSDWGHRHHRHHLSRMHCTLSPRARLRHSLLPPTWNLSERPRNMDRFGRVTNRVHPAPHSKRCPGPLRPDLHHERKKKEPTRNPRPGSSHFPLHLGKCFPGIFTYICTRGMVLESLISTPCLVPATRSFLFIYTHICTCDIR